MNPSNLYSYGSINYSILQAIAQSSSLREVTNTGHNGQSMPSSSGSPLINQVFMPFCSMRSIVQDVICEKAILFNVIFRRKDIFCGQESSGVHLKFEIEFFPGSSSLSQDGHIKTSIDWGVAAFAHALLSFYAGRMDPTQWIYQWSCCEELGAGLWLRCDRLWFGRLRRCGPPLWRSRCDCPAPWSRWPWAYLFPDSNGRPSITSKLLIIIKSNSSFILMHHAPLLLLLMIQLSPMDWKYVSEPLNDGLGSGLTGRRVRHPRGKALGGTTSINFMLYVRGNRNDYENWARVTGDPRWSYEVRILFSK